MIDDDPYDLGMPLGSGTGDGLSARIVVADDRDNFEARMMQLGQRIESRPEDFLLVPSGNQ